ncbi:MAG: hypothetical protein KF901_12685 [Myxococcales bacterium]|nr:hypothetical protein [Myxococcales bacterium]
MFAKLRLSSPHARLARALVTSGLLLALCAACLASVDGDRAASGECPPDERCSELTPNGLIFVGRAFFDEPRLRLGPVITGGTFALGIVSADLPEFAIETPVDIFTAERGTGVFGPTTAAGEPLYAVDAHLVLRAVSEGTAFVRVVDPSSGELFDRLAIDTYDVDEVQVVLAQDVEREHLLAGCEEMVGVRLYGKQGTSQVRGFDESFEIRVDAGDIETETRFWDCIFLGVPDDRDEVRFDVMVGGATHTQTLPVMSLSDAGRDACPVVVRD